MNYPAILSKSGMMPKNTLIQQSQNISRTVHLQTLQKLQSSKFLNKQITQMSDAPNNLNQDLSSIKLTIEQNKLNLLRAQIIEKDRKITQIELLCERRNIDITHLEAYISAIETQLNEFQYHSKVNQPPETPISRAEIVEVFELKNDQKLSSLEEIRAQVIELIDENNNLQEKNFELESELMMKEIE